MQLHRWQVHRAVWEARLPALEISRRIVRVEARALVPGAPSPIPEALPSNLTLAWLSQHWRVTEKQIRRLMRAGHLPCWRQPLWRNSRADCPKWRWVMRREDFVAFVQAHTTRTES